MSGSTSTPNDFLDTLMGSSITFDDDDRLSVGSVTDSITSDSQNGNNKLSRFFITFWPETVETKWSTPDTWFADTAIVNVFCGQYEICPDTKKLHCHLYIELKREHRMKFAAICTMVKRITGKTGNVKPAKKASANQRACAVNYVLKPDSRAEDTEPFIWEHNTIKVAFDQALWDKRPIKKPSKEDVTEKQVNWIEAKAKHWSWAQILHESLESKLLFATCSWGPKYHSQRYAEIPRRTIKQVIILYGAGGTGKTTFARHFDTHRDEAFEERYYKRNFDDGHFWGGGKSAYVCQRVVHLEEFGGQESMATFKELTDIGNRGPPINIKGSGGVLNHDTIIITSNHHPAAWYRHALGKDPKQWFQLARRFTQVLFFPEHKSDGSRNSPTSDDDYHYIDQTETFMSNDFRENYSKATEHAKEFWPLPEDNEGGFGGISHTFNVPDTAVNEFHRYCQTGRASKTN